jgi:orotate phosphoribosyltransferase
MVTPTESARNGISEKCSFTNEMLCDGGAGLVAGRDQPSWAHAGAVVDTITALLAGRRGHFLMESGYHSGSWFELGTLFDHPAELRPFIVELARRLSSHGIDAVCGPMTGGAKLADLIGNELGVAHHVADRFEAPGATGLFPITYRIPGEERPKLRGRSVAIVDDAISAGSAVRGTYTDLIACGARPVALGALIVFGDAAAAFAARTGLALEGIERTPLDMWRPAECPLCGAGIALETVSAGG